MMTPMIPLMWPVECRFAFVLPYTSLIAIPSEEGNQGATVPGYVRLESRIQGEGGGRDRVSVTSQTLIFRDERVRRNWQVSYPAQSVSFFYFRRCRREGCGPVTFFPCVRSIFPLPRATFPPLHQTIGIDWWRRQQLDQACLWCGDKLLISGELQFFLRKGKFQGVSTIL